MSLNMEFLNDLREKRYSYRCNICKGTMDENEHFQVNERDYFNIYLKNLDSFIKVYK